jgi:hypothetical protein
MNTVTTRNRWTNKEVRLAKETLKITNGNQKRAAIILSTQLDRSLVSIQVRLCSLAKQHPSLRKKNIAKRIMKTATQTPVVATATPVTTTEVKEVKSVTIEGNRLIITF